MTYKVTDGKKTYVLRVHKPVEGFNIEFLRMGKYPAQLIAGEMELLLFLEKRATLQRKK